MWVRGLRGFVLSFREWDREALGSYVHKIGSGWKNPRNPRNPRGCFLNRNPLHLVEAHFVAPAIVELRRAGRGMVCHRRSVFERAAIFQIGGDARCPKGVIADLGLDAGAASTPADHGVSILLGQGGFGELRRSCGRWCETAAPWGRRRSRCRRDRRAGRSQDCGGTASRGACRPSRAAAPIAGGSARTRRRPSWRAPRRCARTKTP